jgi:hypothetical protein
MTTRLMDSLVEELNEKLGNRPFYTLTELVSIGFFGSMTGARAFLRLGRLPHIKISPRRCVIAREHVIVFIKENFHDKSGNLDNFSEGCASNDK